MAGVLLFFLFLSLSFFFLFLSLSFSFFFVIFAFSFLFLFPLLCTGFFLSLCFRGPSRRHVVP